MIFTAYASEFGGHVHMKTFDAVGFIEASLIVNQWLMSSDFSANIKRLRITRLY